MKIAIQGIEGSFHAAAAQAYFAVPFTVTACRRFADVFEALRRGTADAAVMAIENTIAGTILPNMTLLRQSGFQITGEIMMRIEHSCLAHPGVSIHDIREVRSHPMALQQCEDFLRKLGDIQIVETWDTAAAAMDLAAARSGGSAVIAHAGAAERWGLHVVARGVESNKRNYTRFLVIDPSQNVQTGNKASICLGIEHRAGSLASVLAVLANEGINITKIQSTPIPGREWEYYMHLDVEFAKQSDFDNDVQHIRPLIQEFQLLGIYYKGRTIE